MKKIILILLLIVGCTHNNHKKNNLIKNIFLYEFFDNLPASQENKAYKNSQSLIGPLGQLEWRSLYHPDKSYIPNDGLFNCNESGDASYHTGILLQGLALKCKNGGECDTTSIEKIISYYELSQAKNNGSFVRDFVVDSCYSKFLPQEQNGTSSGSNASCPSGKCMKYRSTTINGVTYWVRYDISPDLVIQSLAGLYYVYKNVPSHSNRALGIIRSQYTYYQGNNYILKDDSGINMLYGDHSVSSAPQNYFFVMFFDAVLNGGGKATSMMVSTYSNYIAIQNLFQTYVSGVYKNKIDRSQFNNYNLMTELYVLYDLGFDVKNGIKSLFNEADGEGNLYNNAIYNKVFGTYYPTARDVSLPLIDYHTVGYKDVDFVVGYGDRILYNFWENSAYRLVIKNQSKGAIANEFIIQSYWIR